MTIYKSFEDAVNDEVIRPLNAAHVPLQEFNIQGLSERLIEWSDKHSGYVAKSNSRKFWEIADDYSIIGENTA